MSGGGDANRQPNRVKIAVDVRRIRDFGVGTYIRNLLTCAVAGSPTATTTT